MAAELVQAPHDLQTSAILQNEPLNPTLTALSTLSLLNLRLSRVEYLLTGTSDLYTQSNDHAGPTISTDKDVPQGTTRSTTTTVPTQLRELESRLTHLKRFDGLPGSLIRMVDSLRKELPELFPATSTLTTLAPTTSSNAVEQGSTSKHDLSHRANEVLSHSTLYTSSSSHLQTLQTLRTPPASQSANLINARPHLEQLKKRQEAIDIEIQELRGRSAKVLEWWVKTGVVGMGELWEDWEGRVKNVEREVRRVERQEADEG